MTSKQYFCVGELLNYQKILWMHSNGDCTTVKYHTKKFESWQKNCVFRLSLGLFTQIKEFKYKQANKMIETGVLVWKSKNMSHIDQFFLSALVAKCLKLNDVLTCLTTSPNQNAKLCWGYTQEGGRNNCITELYPVLIHWWVVYATLLLCWKTACFNTLLSFTQTFHIAELYAILTHCWGITYLITLLSNSQRLILCWAITNPNTLLRYTLSYYIAK